MAQVLTNRQKAWAISSKSDVLMSYKNIKYYWEKRFQGFAMFLRYFNNILPKEIYFIDKLAEIWYDIELI